MPVCWSLVLIAMGSRLDSVLIAQIGASVEASRPRNENNQDVRQWHEQALKWVGREQKFESPDA